MAPPAVVHWVNKHFPKPTVDLEWLDGCCEWLIDDQHLSPTNAFPQFVERVKEQLLESDLADSMSKGTGLNPNIIQATTDLQGPPIMVQIIALTEIGTSAFQLEQTRVAREERMRSGQGNIEGEEDGDVEVEGEGPMPKYPRGTLGFRLSDGETVIDAMEYRSLPQLALGITELGCKMQLKGTKIQNGMALLEPATVILLGGRQADCEARQLTEFKQSLRARLGRPLSPEPEAQVQLPPAAELPRSPLREISPPPVVEFTNHTDDLSMEPRRRIPVKSSLNDPPIASTSTNSHQTRPIISLPRHTRASLNGIINNAVSEEAPQIKRPAQSPYFDQSTWSDSKLASSSKQMHDMDFTFAYTTRQLAPNLPSPEPSIATHPEAEDLFDFNLLDEVGGDENLPPTWVDKGKGPEHTTQATTSSRTAANNIPITGGDSGSDDYFGMDDIDLVGADFWDKVDRVIEKAGPVAPGDTSMPAAHPPFSASISGTRTSSSLDKKVSFGKTGHPRSSAAPTHPPSTRTLDVIEIEDSDDDMYEAEDKENQPVPARHVRQRMDTSSPFPGLSQRSGRPVVLATKPEDVIDLSDSD